MLNGAPTRAGYSHRRPTSFRQRTQERKFDRLSNQDMTVQIRWVKIIALCLWGMIEVAPPADSR